MKSLRRARRLPLALCVVAAAAIAATVSGPTATAAPADAGAATYVPDPAWGLDAGFGDHGLEFGPGGEVAQAVAPDGDRTWFAGSVVGRLDATGALDTSIGGGRGYVMLAKTDGRASYATSMVIDDQGRPVVAGYVDTPSDNPANEPGRSLMVARFTPDLRPDTSFGDDGVFTLSRYIAADSVARDVQLQPDGAIVVAGSAATVGVPYRMLVARVTPDGVLDQTFGNEGVTTVDAGPAPAYASGVTITSDAKIVVAGRAGRIGGLAQGSVARLLPEGYLDPTFGGDGVVAVPGPGLSDVVRLPTRRLAVMGRTSDRGGYTALRLVQLSGTGSALPWPGSSSTQRTLELHGLQEADPRSLALQHSGKLVIAGTASPSANYFDQGYLVVRALADGALAPGFAEGGHVLIPWRDEPGEDSEDLPRGAAQAVVVNDRDQIVVGGVVDRPSDESPILGIGIARFAATTGPLSATTELREARNTGDWRSCGTTPSTPCLVEVGHPARFGGRTWPVADTGGLRLQVQRTDGTDNVTVPGTATPEGNVRISLTATEPGQYRARLKVPASGTTLLTAGAWRYFQVAS